MTIEVSEFLKALSEHNKTTNGYQLHLNSADLDDKVSVKSLALS